MTGFMKLPVFVPVTTRIAGVLGILQSIVSIALFSVAIHTYLHGCDALEPDTTNAVNIFGKLIKQYFFIADGCEENKFEVLRIPYTVTPFQIFTWAAVGISFNSLWLIISVVILLYVRDETIRNVNMVLYPWCIITLCVTVIDFTLGILLGITFGKITDAMTEGMALSENSDVHLFNEPALFYLALLRLAALLLMSISFRGFVMIIINLTLIGIILWHTYEIYHALNGPEHPIHSRSPINAFAGNKPQHTMPHQWQVSASEFDPAHSASSSNRPFPRSEQDDRSTWRTNIDRELANSRNYEPPNWRAKEQLNMTSRPFSYLEEPRPIRHPIPVSSPTVANPMTPPWKRNSNWESTPPVPAPDYSPMQNKKLKSALKSGYNYQ